MANSPSPVDKGIIQTRWQDGKCPVCDGVILPIGRIIGRRLKWIELPEEGTYRFEIDRYTDIRPDSNGNIPNVNWTPFSEMYEIRDYVRNLAVGCGESSINGSHGFVALSNLREDELRWMAYFCNSNPFKSCKLEAEAIVARSTFGIVLRFPIDRPQDVEVVSEVVEI